MILNAEDHLDSDLAVDGLTLLDAVHGHWRWHYPGTPYMGILPMLSSYPQALVWGANPITLVSGGTVIWVLVVVSTFWLAWRAYGLEVAGWAIVPLVFSSLGTIWLSGRITGGHLLTLVWHTLAFVGLYACLTRGGWQRAAALGLWCGLGLYLDAMFLFTLAGIVPAALLAWLSTGTVASRDRPGRRVPGRDAGRSRSLAKSAGGSIRTTPIPRSSQATLERQAICGTRPAAGAALPAAADRRHRARSARKGGVSIRVAGDRACWPRAALGFDRPAGQGEWLAIVLVVGFRGRRRPAGARPGVGQPIRPARRSAAARCARQSLIVAAFLVNRNIFNSDNYRYLIFLLTPWSLGFGLCDGRPGAAGLGGPAGGRGSSPALLVEVMTVGHVPLVS